MLRLRLYSLLALKKTGKVPAFLSELSELLISPLQKGAILHDVARSDTG